VDLARVVAEILRGYALPVWGDHGLAHWGRVMENGLRLARRTGADTEVITLFALFHDSRRENEWTDPDHGRRGAELALSLRGRFFELSEAAFALLYRACELHTDCRWDPDRTVQTCFDADRLDLGRVGLTPDPDRLCTKAARDPDMLGWAHQRAVEDVVAEVIAGFDVPARGW
jgi:uncharacterized protein